MIKCLLITNYSNSYETSVDLLQMPALLGISRISTPRRGHSVPLFAEGGALCFRSCGCPFNRSAGLANGSPPTLPLIRPLLRRKRSRRRGAAPRRGANAIDGAVAHCVAPAPSPRRFRLHLVHPGLGDGQGCIDRCNQGR